MRKFFQGIIAGFLLALGVYSLQPLLAALGALSLILVVTSRT